MIDTVIKKQTPVRQTRINLFIQKKNLTDISNGIINKLVGDGWKTMYNRIGDLICIELEKNSISPEDVSLFEKLAPYIDDNSSTEFTPQAAQKSSGTIWWFFERGGMRESHWGVEL